MKKKDDCFSSYKVKLAAIKELNIFKGLKIKQKDWDFLAKKIIIKKYNKNDVIIEQNEFGKELFFIFNGSVDVIVNGDKKATRKAMEHVGEIATLFTNMRRTATNIVAEDSYLGVINSDSFIPFVEKNPLIYRQVALTLAQRLEQRNCTIRKNNDVLKIFIGSSKEGLKKINGIIKKLKQIKCEIKKWDSDIFQPSKTAIESLEEMLYMCDFGIIVLTPDDKSVIRGKKHIVPRDNLIFELGLLMGAISRNRTFFFVSDKVIKTPTDLASVTHLTFKETDKIIDMINKYGCR